MCSLEDRMCQNRDFACACIFFLLRRVKGGKMIKRRLQEKRERER